MIIPTSLLLQKYFLYIDYIFLIIYTFVIYYRIYSIDFIILIDYAINPIKNNIFNTY